MRRKYKKRIEVWTREAQYDGVAGNTVVDTKLSDSWCNLESVPLNKLTQYGLNINQQAIRITLRYRNDLDYFDTDIFFKYNNKEWVIDAIRDNDQELEELTIIATAR